MSKTKACVGLSNIHFAPFNGGEFETPVRISHAKKIENKFKYENIQEWADNIAVINEFLYGGGEGSLTTLGLSKEERVLLFGNKAVKGGVAVTDSDEAPIGAFLFERRLVGGAKRFYVVYACKCSPTDISGETIEEGKGNYETNDIEYSISSCEHEGVNLVYFYIDTNDSTVDQQQVTKWFKEVQFPQEITDTESLKATETNIDDGTGRIKVTKSKKQPEKNIEKDIETTKLDSKEVSEAK